MGALTKADITDELSRKIGLNKREAKQMVEIFYNEIADELAQGHFVKLSGFGNFNLRDKKERPGRNPKTGVEVAIKPRRVVTFHAGQKLKARVENYVGPELQKYGGSED